MKIHNHQTARNKILELCSEDDYGVWELFWAVAPFFKHENQDGNTETVFIQLMKDLIDEGLIVSKAKKQKTGQLEISTFDEKKLAIQIKNLNQPLPESFYWFGFHESQTL
jgi:hypothetical protein